MVMSPEYDAVCVFGVFGVDIAFMRTLNTVDEKWSLVRLLLYTISFVI